MRLLDSFVPHWKLKKNIGAKPKTQFMLQTVYISSLPEQGRSRSIASQSSPPEFDQVTSYLPMSSPEEEPSKSQTPTENGESHYKPEPSPSETEPVLEQLPTAPAPEPEQFPPGSEPEPETSSSEAEIASDPIPEQPAETEIQSSDAVIEAEPEIEKEAVVPAAEQPVMGLRKDEGSRKFTMRELLDELKVSEASESEKPDPVSPYSHRSKQMDQNDISMELINSVTGVDEEGRSRQRILTYAARRYATAIERNPEDHDAFYNWALVLQESADNVAPDSSSPSKDALLEEACKKYDETTRLCPTLHDAYYNWAIAISDRAKMRGRTKEAEELWKQATKNYEKAVQLNWNSPQALNNWGLALQELSAIVPVREKESIVRDAISKFRASIRLQFDFHRAIYNLGTVLYGLAEDTSRSGEPVGSKDVSANELYSQSAIYIAVAHALKANYSVYHSALRLVRSMLPLPYLKVGHLTAPPPGKAIAPHSDWKRSEFILNQEGLHQLGAVIGNKSGIKVEIPDIVSVSACADLTLPPGAGMCIDTIHGPVYMVADSWESLDGWLDAIRLVYTIFARGKSDVLASIITG